jgi:hypothetical protein
MKCQQASAAASTFMFLFVAAYPLCLMLLIPLAATPGHGDGAVEGHQGKAAQVAAGALLFAPLAARCSFWSSRRSRRCQSSLLGRKIQVQQLLTQHMNLMHEVYSTLLQRDLSAAPSPRLDLQHARFTCADGWRREQQPLSGQRLSQCQQEVLKLKEDIEHRLQQQVLALRQVVADVERSASLAVLSSVKLHNKQRWGAAARACPRALNRRPVPQVPRARGRNRQVVEQRAGNELHPGAAAEAGREPALSCSFNFE